MTQEDIKKLLTFTEELLKHTYWFKQEFEVKPKKEHIATSINYTDIQERRSDFLNSLKNTINNFVYSKAESVQLFDKFFEDSNDFAHASSKLSNLAKSKFRPGHPQGQFGELLLFNFIQHFFEAPPILRKMKIATSQHHERFGADAIHYKIDSENHNVFILGESKCYISSYKFNTAIKDSLKSIISSFANISNELELYTYEKGMIDESLIPVVESYKNNTLSDIKFELVCIIIYEETNKITGDNEQEIKDKIKEIIENRFKDVPDTTFSEIQEATLKRINYIVLPVWGLDSLLSDFQTNF